MSSGGRKALAHCPLGLDSSVGAQHDLRGSSALPFTRVPAQEKLVARLCRLVLGVVDDNVLILGDYEGEGQRQLGGRARRRLTITVELLNLLISTDPELVANSVKESRVVRNDNDCGEECQRRTSTENENDPPPPFHTLSAAMSASRPSISCETVYIVSKRSTSMDRPSQTHEMVGRLVEKEDLRRGIEFSLTNGRDAGETHVRALK